MYEAHSEMAWLRIPDAFVMLIQSYSTTTEIASKEKCVFRLVECCFTQAEIEAAVASRSHPLHRCVSELIGSLTMLYKSAWGSLLHLIATMYRKVSFHFFHFIFHISFFHFFHFFISFFFSFISFFHLMGLHSQVLMPGALER